VRGALREAALKMTTLNLREDALHAAVDRYSSVADLRVTPDFPRKLTIEVVERHPVATVELGGSRVPVGAGGMLMRGVRPQGPLPTLAVERIGPDGRVADRRALGTIAVLAAAPAELRPRVTRARSTPRGLVLDLRNGPQLIFGGASQPRAKWAAAVRVLADHTSAGAVYLDLRLPERVAAGGVGPLDNPQPTPEPTPTLEAH
jgi:cell division protein FtsQ